MAGEIEFMLNDILGDARLRDTASDVVIRLREHGEYGKDEAKALKALARRLPDQSSEACEKIFRLMSDLLADTIAAVGRAPLPKKPKQKWADPSDIDAEFVLSHLRSRFPDYRDEILKTFVGWVTYWHYLR